MIDTQQRAALDEESKQPSSAELATISAIYSDGITLIFDGTSAASAKHYKCNIAVAFTAGQRVKICKVSGTYIVEYPVGAPTT